MVKLESGHLKSPQLDTDAIPGVFDKLLRTSILFTESYRA